MDMTIFLIFVITVFFTAKLQKKEHVLCYYKRYLPILEQMIANIRKNQHNYNNTIQTIAALPQVYTSYDELASTLTKFDKQIQNKIIPTRFLDFESKLLSALLYNKYCTACEKRIRLNFTILNYTYHSRCDEFEIIDIVGILLDNALDACCEDDTIYVEIGMPDPSNNASNSAYPPFSIIVKNPGPEATQDYIHMIFSEKYSSKENYSGEHGLGLPYLQSIIRKYKGQIEIKNEIIAPEENEIAKRYFVICVSV